MTRVVLLTRLGFEVGNPEYNSTLCKLRASHCSTLPTFHIIISQRNRSVFFWYRHKRSTTNETELVNYTEMAVKGMRQEILSPYYYYLQDVEVRRCGDCRVEDAGGK